MKHVAWTKRKSALTLTLCAIIATSTIIILQNTKTTQAALIAPPSPPSGQVGWWKFDEGAGSVVRDSSGFGNNGTNYGATWVGGEYGSALSFNGVNNYVDIPNSASLPFSGTNPWTITMWVNYTSGNNYYPEFCKGAPTGPGFTIHGIDGRIQGGSGSQSFDTSGMFQTDLRGTGWRYTVITYDGSTFRGYLDGQPKGTFSWTGGIGVTSSYDIWLGKFWGQSYNGAIDEVQIYNRALTAGEVLQNFQNGPAFSATVIAKVPAGTTQVITTLSWQGVGSINATITSPSQTYTEATIPEYQKTSYSTSSGITSMLNIKRLSVSVSALPADQSWTIVLTFDTVSAYQITVEVQK